MISISLTEDQMYQALGNFLAAILPSSVEVVRGQVNRVPEVNAPDFVVMTSLMRDRLETNTDGYVDALFTGSIAGNTLNISAVTRGALAVGVTIFGVDVAPGTTITALGTGSGGVGSYTVSGAPQTVTSQAIAAGVEIMLQPTNATVQLDVHGPAAADNMQIITTLFRDSYGVDLFKASGFDVTPLYCDEGHQLPFTNEQDQVETRWVISAAIQVNPALTAPQQAMGTAAVQLKNVDVFYPPT